jgi:capsular exopolysaccharide synthesis family protein
MAQPNHKNIIESYDPESPVGTEFRRLIHNLTHSRLLPEGAKTFLITSPSVGEGKSSISAFLAVTGALHKPRKTLLVDADLRRPMVHKLFGVQQDGGLTDIIADGVKLENCIKKTGYENLHIITAGRNHKNPTELFDSPTISDFFEAAQFYYEMIIVDTAPIIPVSDPLILSGEVDGICLVVKAGVTQREVVTRACELIEQAGGARLLGVVMNNVKHALPYYYNHKYYGYHYHSSK